jgi:hypothetical protein
MVIDMDRLNNISHCWKKSRIVARLLRKREWSPRDYRLAEVLAKDPSVENRLIDQALHSLSAERILVSAIRESPL